MTAGGELPTEEPISALVPAPDLDRAGLEAAARVAALMVAVPDFPSPGIVFQDVTPVLADPVTFDALVSWLGRCLGPVDAVAGIEARGFVLGAPVALRLGVPFVPIRKAGKLPRAVYEESYDLEYGSATLAVHTDAPYEGLDVLVVDDVLATGGTAAAAAALVRRGGGRVAGVGVLLEIAALGGRARLTDVPVRALVRA